MKLNYSFSKREIAMILLLVLALLGLLYYRFIYLGINDQVQQYDTADLEAQIQLRQMQVIEWQGMQDEIDEVGTVSTSSLETYDNQKREINLLNDIFEPVIRYNFSFEKPVATGDTVRRNVNVSFTTIDYYSALDIITKLHNSPYRVLIHDFSITPGDLTVDYLNALATQALSDQKALAQLKKQVNNLIASNKGVDPYVMKVYNEEPLTEAPETEDLTETEIPEGMEGQEPSGEQAVPEGQEIPQETVPEEGGVVEGDATAEGTETSGDAAVVPEGGTAETLEDGTVVAPEALSETAAPEPPPVTEELQTEKPVQTLENCIINVNMSMTFYETIYGATNLDGLIIEKTDTAQEQ